ncbi:plasmid pRiA4b ORF-3 family protein [Polaromonas sp. JS666]|uniref:plasmid pRiA4b ORF-3 family protein n=1 Tax=Polaromonas sp. (strain JS666 / ATCC BAA-500) TaxID=296591 RepID=UPI0000535126|nr:plasmid pRiA4b ORF-3 family protein [Polaromonas sp. JS666]ABE47384.1 plasmid pRiA4b ORF-3-like [Polaromonas sp. JS666]
MTAQLFKLPAKTRSKSTKSYQLRVELKGVKPAVWRRIGVPSTIKLSKLHHILLAVMGWQGGHLHEFIFADAMYGQADEEMEPGVEDESRVSLVKALAGSTSFTWVYDYGDYWAHKVKLERIVDLGVPLDTAMCMTGRNACPPEDIGGAPGYEEFLEAIRDPQHPEHQAMLQRCGGAFDPSEFDPMEAQERLDGITI